MTSLKGNSTWIYNGEFLHGIPYTIRARYPILLPKDTCKTTFTSIYYNHDTIPITRNGAAANSPLPYGGYWQCNYNEQTVTLLSLNPSSTLQRSGHYYHMETESPFWPSPHCGGACEAQQAEVNTRDENPRRG
jgi:hypothetical protein